MINDSDRDTSPEAVTGPSIPASNDHWIALGLVAIGMIGAVVGFAQLRPRRVRLMPPTTPDTGEMTPPHGDKLLRRR